MKSIINDNDTFHQYNKSISINNYYDYIINSINNKNVNIAILENNDERMFYLSILNICNNFTIYYTLTLTV